MATNSTRALHLTHIALLAAIATPAQADVTTFDSLPEWQAAAGSSILESFSSVDDMDPFRDGYNLSSGSIQFGIWELDNQDDVLEVTFSVPGTSERMSVLGAGIRTFNFGLYDIRAFNESGQLIAEETGIEGDESPDSPWVGFLDPDGIYRLEVEHTRVGGVSIDDLAIAHESVGGGNFGPTAQAGSNKTARVGDTVILDGTDSTDHETPTESLQFLWSITSVPTGSNAVLANANTAAPSFYGDIAGTYVVQLIVTDEGGLSSAPDHVEVTISYLIPRVASVSFNDAPPDYWAFPFVETLAGNGITVGCSDGHFCPDDFVTRAQMAVFLERSIRGADFVPPPATGNAFLDVEPADFAADFIELLYADGITGGCGSSRYCPTDSVTRAQMAVFLLRAIHGSSYTPPAPTGLFDDVDLAYWAVSWIEQLANEGITSGCGAANYCPDEFVTRAQMAVFIVRAFGLVNKADAASLYPTDWKMPVGTRIRFRSNLAGQAEWSVNGIPGGNDDVGRINGAGWYSAPAAVPGANPVTIQVALSADSTISAAAPVEIVLDAGEDRLSWNLWTPRVAQRNSDDVLTLDAAFSGYPTFEFERMDGVRLHPVPLSTGQYRWYIPTEDVLMAHEIGDLKNLAGILYCNEQICQQGGRLWDSISGGIEIPVLDESIPASPILELDGTAQAASHVLNVRHDGAYGGFSWPAASRKFYQYFPDEFDFITLVQPRDFALTDWTPGRASGGHRKNDISGIGVEIYDYSHDVGSAGRLHGAVQFGWAAGFDYAGWLYLHELGHTWAAYLDQPPINARSHWPAVSTLAAGPNIGSTLEFIGVGEDLYQLICHFVGVSEEYADVELYLMGLISPDEVPPQIVARDQSSAGCGDTVEADVVTIEDIIAQYGARTPDHTVARKDFKMATVIYSMDRLLSPAEMSWFNHMSNRAEARVPLPYKKGGTERDLVNPFYTATGGRATMSTRIIP